MLGSLIKWFMEKKDNRNAKIGAGFLSGSGILLIIFNLHADVTKKINDQDTRQKEHVKLVIEPIKTEIRNIKEEQTEIKTMVRDIHKYLLKTKNK